METPKPSTHIIRVRFNAPLRGFGDETDFYFTSLAAIYLVFTPKQIGCKVENLWASHIEPGRPFESNFCTISKCPVYRKAQKNPQSAKSEPL